MSTTASNTYENWMKKVDREIYAITAAIGEAGCLGRSDFADTVFTRDAFDNGESPKEVAEQILGNDSIGQQILELYHITKLAGGDL